MIHVQLKDSDMFSCVFECKSNGNSPWNPHTWNGSMFISGFNEGLHLKELYACTTSQSRAKWLVFYLKIQSFKDIYWKDLQSDFQCRLRDLHPVADPSISMLFQVDHSVLKWMEENRLYWRANKYSHGLLLVVIASASLAVTVASYIIRVRS